MVGRAQTFVFVDILKFYSFKDFFFWLCHDPHFLLPQLSPPPLGRGGKGMAERLVQYAARVGWDERGAQ